MKQTSYLDLNKMTSFQLTLNGITHSYLDVPLLEALTIKKSLQRYELTGKITRTDKIEDTFNQLMGKKKYWKSALILRTTRMNSGFSQKKLASLTNIKQENISLMENAKRGIGIKTAKLFSVVFHKPAKEFIST